LRIVETTAFDFYNGLDKEKKRERERERAYNDGQRNGQREGIIKGSSNRLFALALNRGKKRGTREPKDTQRANSIVTAIRASSRARERESRSPESGMTEQGILDEKRRKMKPEETRTGLFCKRGAFSEKVKYHTQCSHARALGAEEESSLAPWRTIKAARARALGTDSRESLVMLGRPIKIPSRVRTRRANAPR